MNIPKTQQVDALMPFQSLIAELSGKTLVDRFRCKVLYEYAKAARAIEGDAAEVGVYKGGTARLLARTLAESGKRLHLFDTFEGMPEPTPGKDLHRKGDFSDTSLAEVKEYLKDCRLISFYPGLFPSTARALKHRTFSIVHIDADIYQSVLESCRFFYPRLNRGGVMIFDDYGFPSCPGAKGAINEFFGDRKSVLKTGQCIVRKEEVASFAQNADSAKEQ